MKEYKTTDEHKGITGLESIKPIKSNIASFGNVDNRGARCEEYALTLVGSNQGYFNKVFKIIDNGGSKFNLCGLLFDIYYIIYRKMFRQYFKFSIMKFSLFVFTVISLFISIMNPSSLFVTAVGIPIQVIYILLSYLYRIYISVTFNKKYYNHIKSLSNSNMSLEQVKSNTGPSYKRLVVAITISIILALTIATMQNIIFYLVNPV